ncbi:MAG: DNA mismatch repair endonuclease MutL [Kiritimatiellae bacterium]|nr:DNA mismatch repair endonuclease MutL [Kiritimatiellia bacterium]
MTTDGHVHLLPLHVANKIAAGEVVERPASVVKELVENAIDAGAKSIKISIAGGGCKLVAVQDDGCGMCRDDALLSLERQATSKILDVGDIENIGTLGFRGEAIPSIASVSRFVLTTRRHDSDEGCAVHVDAGKLSDVHAAGCPPGTLVEVKDLFCNVPARKKFLRSAATEEANVRNVFTVHALARPEIAFSLIVDGREAKRLPPAEGTLDRIRDLFGNAMAESLVALDGDGVSGYIEKPSFSVPTRRDQYVFINGRPATAPSIAAALRDGYPRRQGESRPAVFLFLSVPAGQVDVNVHPAKREVRFRNNAMIRTAIVDAIGRALAPKKTGPSETPVFVTQPKIFSKTPPPVAKPVADAPAKKEAERPEKPAVPEPEPIAAELPIAADETTAKPWVWFKFLASTQSGYLLIETDTGVVTVNPHAARERIAYERLLSRSEITVQQLLIPETVRLSTTDFARIRAAWKEILAMGFELEEFGRDTCKIEAVPQLIGTLSPSAVLSTIAHDLSEGGARHGGRWREELIARSIARSFAGSPVALDEKSAVKLVEELAATKMPYVCPRGKPIMIFTSTRELDRKFAR